MHQTTDYINATKQFGYVAVKNQFIGQVALMHIFHQFLGATPFRLYGDNGVVSIKCPKKEFGKSLQDARKTISFWAGTAADRRVNYKSHWYFEIQGQLHITERQMGYLMIYLGDDDYEIVEIERNDEFWKQEMEQELVYFYNEALIKELVNPRDERGMDIRKYNPKSQTFE